MTTSDAGRPTEGAGARAGRSAEPDDTPLPDLPPLPTDPRWRIEHLPMVVAAGLALTLCAASIGLVLGGVSAALGAAAGVALVAASLTMSTLVIAGADAIRPALVLPAGLLIYVIKFALIAFIMLAVMASDWSGRLPMAWAIAGGVVVLTAVQVLWVLRLARRNQAAERPDVPRPRRGADQASDGAGAEGRGPNR